MLELETLPSSTLRGVALAPLACSQSLGYLKQHRPNPPQFLLTTHRLESELCVVVATTL